MWEAIASNQRRSWMLIAALAVLLALLGLAIGGSIAREAAPVGALIALGIWLVLLMLSFAGGDSLLLASARARQIAKADSPRLWNVVEEMTIASGLGVMPKVYIIDSDAPNAFAIGIKPEHAAVAVTSGLLKRLDRDELQGVIAHEIGHIRNLDIRFLTIASVMVGSIALLADFFLRTLRYGGGRRSSSKGGGQGQALFLALAIVLAILAPLVAQILYFACSRRREFLADASGALYTRYPEGLASALEKIAVHAGEMEEVNRALAPLFIVNPLQGLGAAGVFSTHPPTDLRIRILRSMSGGAGYVDYENAYRKLRGAKERLIGLRTLAESKSLPQRGPSQNSESAVERSRDVAGILDRLAQYITLACACGVAIKVPPGLDQRALRCPRCARQHDVPQAEPAPPPAPAAGGAPAGDPPPPLRFERRGEGWESFQCACGHVIQLSPEFVSPSTRCRKCKRSIEIADARSEKARLGAS
jgi:heat shock protein HtpX